MKATNRFATRAGLILGSALILALTGCRTHVVHERTRTVYVPAPPPPPVVYVSPAPASQPPPVVHAAPSPAPVVVIQSVNDFYEPLALHGRWVVVGDYGRSWIPAGVPTGWRPYANGYWQRTDAGWYWMSDEPWGWATYHYGRWDWHTQYGWVWVPHTQWATAWVSWREGGGYVGWAPLRPSATMGVSISTVQYEPAFATRAYVFVEHRRMLEPVRPTTVVVNNTTIINKTVNITNVKVVNQTVINEGPQPEVIERASGRKVQAVPVHEIRRKEEVAVTARQRNVPTVPEKKLQAPARTEPQAAPREAALPRNPQIVEKPAATVTPPQAIAKPVRPTPPPTVAENPPRVEIKPAVVPVRQVPTTPPTVAPKAMPEVKPAQAVPVRRAVRPVAKPAGTAKPTPLPLTTTPVREELQREVVSDKARPARLPAVETRTRNEVRPLTNPEVKAPARVETAPTSPVKNLPAPPKPSPTEKRLISPREHTRAVEPADASRRAASEKTGQEQTPRLVPTRPSR